MKSINEGHDPECESRQAFVHYNGLIYCDNCGGCLT